MCFGGEREYKYYFKLQKRREEEEKERDSYKERMEKQKVLQVEDFEKRIKEINSEMENLKKRAMDNGMQSEFRAMEVGRDWNEGDGF